MVGNWWIMTLSLASLDLTVSTCTGGDLNELSTSVKDGYIADEQTGVNFLFGNGLLYETISLSWFVPSSIYSESVNRHNISFEIYHDAGQELVRNINTREVNGSCTIYHGFLHNNLLLNITWHNTTSRDYCCALYACIILAQPVLKPPEETKLSDTFDTFDVTFRPEKAGLFLCKMKYWETGTDTSANNKEIECESLCTLRRVPPYTNFEAQMACIINDDTYTFDTGRMQWSDPIPFSTSEIAPGGVCNLHYSELSTGVNRSVLVVWKPVAETQRYGVILYYTVTLQGRRPNITDCIERKEAHNTTHLNYTLSGLDYVCTYSVNISASNGAGEGPREIVNLLKYEKRPSESTLKELSVTSEAVMLGWYPPTHLYGQISYTLSMKNGDTTLNSVEIAASLENSEMKNYTFVDLKPFTRYEFTLRVENRAGKHREGDLTVTTLQAAPSASPASLTVTGRPGHPTELTVTWTSVPTNQSNGIIVLYTVYWWLMKPSEGCQSERAIIGTMFGENITEVGQRSCIIPELNSSSTYCIAITASTDAGEGPSVSTSATTVKDFITVDSTIIKDITPYSISLEWQLSIPTDYVSALVSTSLMVDGQAVDTNITSRLSYLLEDLVPYTVYNISLHACWLEYQQEGCGPLIYMDIRTKPAKPSAPQKLQVNQLSQGQVNISWSTPASPNGHISYYRVFYFDANNSDSKRERNTTQLNIPDIKIWCSNFATVVYVFEVSAVVSALTELEGPPAKRIVPVCSKQDVLVIIIAVVVVPCSIISICILLVWWCFCYPKKKIEIKVARILYHPKMSKSTGKSPEKEVFDILKSKPDVRESETYMVMTPSESQSTNESYVSQDYLKMSNTHVSDAV